jgi:hypothetical protein
MVHSSPSKSTRQLLVKVPQVPCLYRHQLNRGYYGIKKRGGKRKEHSLKTTDRSLIHESNCLLVLFIFIVPALADTYTGIVSEVKPFPKGGAAVDMDGAI